MNLYNIAVLNEIDMALFPSMFCFFERLQQTYLPFKLLNGHL